MKICACIAEYNPLHFGHIKHIEYIKNVLKAEKVIVVMSGNFTQRGEPAVINKFLRAKHAILSGADMVIELPSVYAVGNAETFSKGAISIINSLGVVDGICFGVESGKTEEYISLAKALNNESKEFKKALKEQLDKGVSLAKAKFEAVKSVSGEKFNESLVSSPNNILGVEYTKALLKCKSKIEIFPMLRNGDHNSKKLKKGETSALSIREILKTGKIKKIKKSVPKFVYKDLNSNSFNFDKIITAKLLSTPAEELKACPDCTEGLENRIKALSKDNKTVQKLVEKVSTKRYTESRIKRILICNLLGIKQEFVKDCLKEGTYAKVLAVKEDGKDLISLISKNSSLPILTRKSDTTALDKTALKCYEIDVLGNDLYNLVTDEKNNEHQTLFI